MEASKCFIADRCQCGNRKRKSHTECTACSAKVEIQNKLSAYAMSPASVKRAIDVRKLTLNEAEAQGMLKEWKKAYPAFADLEGRN